VLVNHANAFFDGIMRARNFYRLVQDTNFPFIRLIKAIQDIHERRFASAIFNQESVNFTSFQGKIDVIIRKNIRKTLGNTRGLYGKCHIFVPEFYYKTGCCAQQATAPCSQYIFYFTET